MLRYKQHLIDSTDTERENPLSLRQLSRATGIPTTTLYSYIELDAVPRPDNMEKLANYYNESISSLYSDDSDTTAKLISQIRKLGNSKQKQLLKELTSGR